MLVIIIVGCGSKQEFFERNKFADRQRPEGFGERPQIDDAQRQKILQEMQQKGIGACQEKTAGDVCEIGSPRGMRQGICQNKEENLICVFERPMGPRQYEEN